MDVRSHNREAWDQNVVAGNRWTQPVDSATVERARQGHLELLLTPQKAVPANWFPEIKGTRILCLASAGGQQAPLLAAAGGIVCVFDNSPKQLEQDHLVAQREGLDLEIVEGDMRDLSVFSDDTFGLIFHPCSNCFVPDVPAVWHECQRTLKPGGILLAGFTNSVRYIFDDERKENGNLEVRYSLPYSDLEHLDEVEIQEIVKAEQPLEFVHTLEDQIGGQLSAGLVMTGFYEDRYSESDNDPLSRYMSSFIATRARKPETAG